MRKREWEKEDGLFLSVALFLRELVVAAREIPFSSSSSIIVLGRGSLISQFNGLAWLALLGLGLLYTDFSL